MHLNDLDDESSRVFFGRLHKGIFVLGLELGFLLQGSTVPIQDWATTYGRDTSSQLLLSLVWSYVLASTGLLLFFFCQRLVKTLLHLEASEDHKELQHDNHYHHHHHHHHLLLVDLQCYFAEGSVLGVFLSWMFLDGLLNFRTRVLYGGIVFLVSLLLLVIRGCLESTTTTTTDHDEKVSLLQQSAEDQQLLHVL